MIKQFSFPCQSCKQSINPNISWIDPKTFTDPTKAKSTFATLCTFCAYPNVLILKYREDKSIDIIDRLPASAIYSLYKIREQKMLIEVPEKAEPINDE